MDLAVLGLNWSLVVVVWLTGLTTFQVRLGTFFSYGVGIIYLFD